MHTIFATHIKETGYVTQAAAQLKGFSYKHPSNHTSTSHFFSPLRLLLEPLFSFFINRLVVAANRRHTDVTFGWVVGGGVIIFFFFSEF